MTSKYKSKEIDIKIRTYHYLDNIININDPDFKNIKKHKK